MSDLQYGVEIRGDLNIVAPSLDEAEFHGDEIKRLFEQWLRGIHGAEVVRVSVDTWDVPTKGDK